MESISDMKQFDRGVSWKAEAMVEMNWVRNSGVGEDVEVVGGRELEVVDEAMATMLRSTERSRDVCGC